MLFSCPTLPVPEEFRPDPTLNPRHGDPTLPQGTLGHTLKTLKNFFIKFLKYKNVKFCLFSNYQWIKNHVWCQKDSKSMRKVLRMFKFDRFLKTIKEICGSKNIQGIFRVPQGPQLKTLPYPRPEDIGPYPALGQGNPRAPYGYPRVVATPGPESEKTASVTKTISLVLQKYLQVWINLE